MNRKQEILSSMPSCSQTEYYRDDLFREIWGLQKETVRIAFNDRHEENGNYKLWDVIKQLEDESKELGGVASDVLGTVKCQASEISNQIRGLAAGRRGEKIVQDEIALLSCPYRLMSNVELKFGDERCEIDDIVIASTGITLIEVKGISKDLYIDRFGRIIRTGKYSSVGENIAEKMEKRERIIRTILQSAGYTNVSISSVLVFTEEKNEIKNLCPNIQVLFPTILANYIETQKSDAELSIHQVPDVIEKFISNNKYPLGFDAEAFKTSFADLVIAIEEAKREKNIDLMAGNEYISQEEPKKGVADQSALPLHTPWYKRPETWLTAGGIAGVFAGVAVIIKKVRKH